MDNKNIEKQLVEYYINSMITVEHLTKIHSDTEYYNHGISLLEENPNYYDDFIAWLNENLAVLKNRYIEMVTNNDNSVISTPFDEWAMQCFIVSDYNRIQEEINNLLS